MSRAFDKNETVSSKFPFEPTQGQQALFKLFDDFLTDNVDNDLKKYFKDELRALEPMRKIAMNVSQLKNRDIPEIIKKYVSNLDRSIGDSTELNAALLDVVPFLEWYQIFESKVLVLH